MEDACSSVERSRGDRQGHPNSPWIVDSGATSHMCNDISLFTELSEKTPIASIEVANQSKAQVDGIGKVDLTTSITSGQKIKLHLDNVLYIFSLGRICYL